MPKCGVELREAGSCSGANLVTISLNDSRSIGEIINVRMRLEGKLYHVRLIVKKIRVKETST